MEEQRNGCDRPVLAGREKQSRMLLDLQDVQTLDDVLRIDWMERTEQSQDGNRRPVFIPDSGIDTIRSLHFHIPFKDRSIIETAMNLKRIQELSDFPLCPVQLTRYKGKLYCKLKPKQRGFFT